MTASQHTIAGRVLTMPVEIRKATQHMAMFSVDADAAQQLIDYSGLQVCRYLPGRTIVVLTFMHYIDGDLEQYREFNTSFMLNPPGSTASGPRALRSAGARAGAGRRPRPGSMIPGKRKNLVNEAGVLSRGWIDYPGHIWVAAWNEGAFYSPDGMIIQFDNGSVWQRVVEVPIVAPVVRRHYRHYRSIASNG